MVICNFPKHSNNRAILKKKTHNFRIPLTYNTSQSQNRGPHVMSYTTAYLTPQLEPLRQALGLLHA